MERTVKFEVCGQEFTLNTDAPEQEVREILDLVKSQIEQNAPSPTLLPAKLAVLVSLNMAGQYVKTRKKYERYQRQVEERLAALSARLEKVLRDGE